MTHDCSLLINQLIVVGVRKNYVVPFNPGVNIIYGDSSTGKSSILNLVNYLLGGKSFDLYPEIEATARFAILDVNLNGIRYCIKRDIFLPLKMIEVFQCSFDEIELHSATKYISTYRDDALAEEYGFYSDFLLDALSLEKVKIKVSPSKADSKVNRLSIRDLLKYCYVDQDDLGSKHFLDRGNFSLEVKNAEVFKYIFNVLDSQITQLQAEISSKTNQVKRLERKFENISEFLRDTDFNMKVDIEKYLENIDADISYISSRIKQVKNRITADDGVYKGIKSAVNEIVNEISITEKSIATSEEKIENFTRLKNDYALDIRKFKSAQEMRSKIGEEVLEITPCPICYNELRVETAKESFQISELEKINQETNSLRRKSRDAEKIVSHYRNNWEKSSIRLKHLNVRLVDARSALDENTVDMVSPYLSETNTMISKLASLSQKKKDLISQIKVRNQQNKIRGDIEQLQSSIVTLSGRLTNLQEGAPSIDQVITNMSDLFNLYLKKVNIKNRYGVGIDTKKYLPYIRNIPYEKLTSGGIRTIASIGYLCAFMRAALKREMNYPTFLMIDTVGKYLGKTKDTYVSETSVVEDQKEGVSDPDKYKNIYEYMIDLSEKYEEENKICQIILVDNDVPQNIVKEYSGFIVAHYSSVRRNGLPVGLIDDADLERNF